MTKPYESEYSILLLEDNPGDADLVREYLDLTNLDCTVTVAARLSDGILKIRHHSYDVILIDLTLPDSHGLETLVEFLDHVEKEPVIVLTGSEDMALSLQALKAGAQDYLFKDHISAHLLEQTIRHSIERADLLMRLGDYTTELEQNESMLRQFFELNVDAMLILSRENVIEFLNPAACEMLDSSPDDLIGAIFPFDLGSQTKPELEIPGPGNSTIELEVSAMDLIWRGQEAMLVVLRNITEHRRSQSAYKSEKERLAVTLESIADAVITTDYSGSVERMNEAASRMLGISQDLVIGKNLEEILHLKHPKTGKIISNPVEILLDAEEHGIRPELGLSLVDAQGAEQLVSADMRHIKGEEQESYGCVLVMRDLSRLKETGEELLKNEKLNSISLLAGGIAHDFNNILTAVLGNISVVRMTMDEDDPLSQKLQAAEKAALQARNLTQQLLTFSKGGTPVLETTTIDQVVEECTQFVLRGSNVRCDLTKDENLWAVDADKGQIAQVINNLIINADQAMPNGGCIRVEMSNKALRANQVAGLSAGKYLCIRVEDEGNGISPENLKRIFDPYFSTKKSGNGLGLASAYSIINAHHGTLTVHSTVAKGTTFHIYLPRSKKPQSQVSTTNDSTSEEIHKGTGRILVMDDMEAMMTVAGEILIMLGYEVAFSTNGEEAIAAYREAMEAGKPFDAVVFDLTVPGGMGGEEASNILRKYDPNIIAIASSGYTTSNVMSDYEDSAFTAVVPKPYRIREMSLALKNALNRK